MESSIAIYKLIVLYLLDRADDEIAMGRVSNFLIENAYVDFEMLLSTYSQIERDGYLTGRSVGDTMFLRITEEGHAVVRMFRNQLSDDIRGKVDSYLKENGHQLREDRSVRGEYYKASYGGYIAHMAVYEDHKNLFTLDLNVPDEATARHIIANFKANSSDVYGAVVGQLFK